MVHAASLSLPLALKNAAKVLKTGEQKDRAGENLIKYFSVPCKPIKSNGGRTRNLPEHNLSTNGNCTRSTSGSMTGEAGSIRNWSIRQLLAT